MLFSYLRKEVLWLNFITLETYTAKGLAGFIKIQIQIEKLLHLHLLLLLEQNGFAMLGLRGKYDFIRNF